MERLNSKALFKKIITIFISVLMIVTTFTVNNHILADDEIGNVEEVNEVVEQNEQEEEITLEEEIVLDEEENKEEEELVEETTLEEEVKENKEEEIPNDIEEENLEEQEEEIPAIEETQNEEEVVYTSGELKLEENDYSVCISYDESAMIPEGAVLSVQEIIEDSDKYNDYLETAANTVFEDEETEADSLPYARFFDITILSKDGEVIEPQSNVNVVIDLKDDVLNTEDVEFSAIHFVEEEDEILEASLVEVDTEEVVSFEAESFSVYGVIYYYTVDFYYQDSEYHMNGGSQMLLSDLFVKLNMDINVSDIKEIIFTDYSLVSIEKDNDDYVLKSLKPFTTHELLTITLNNGETILINVEDATADDRTPGTESGIWWGLTADGTLTIRPQSARTAQNHAYFNTVHLGDTTTPGQATWDSFWKHKNSSKTIRDEVKKVIIKPNENGAGIALDPEKSHLSYMFSGFENLESVEIQEGAFVESTKNLTNMFYGCKKLATITGLDNIDTSDVQDMSSMFNGCEKLTTIDGLDSIDTSNVQNMSSMFRDCKSLTALDLSSFKNAGKLYNMQNMFYGCSSLESVVLNNENFKTRVSSQYGGSGSDGCKYNGMFNGCTNLKSVDLSNITLGGHSGESNDFYELFKNKTNLTKVNLTDIKLPGIKNFGSMFEDCTSLEELDVSSFGKLGNYVVSINDFVKGCTSLKVLNISNLDDSVITTSKRNLGIKTLDSLEELIADNSNVWMIKYRSDGDYTNISSVDDVYFFTDGVFKFDPEGPSYAGTEITTNARGVLDLIVHSTVDGDNNPNNVYPNPNDPGFLAPGTYIRTSETSKDFDEIPMTFYVIDSMKDSTPRVEIETSDGVWEDVTKENGTYGNYVVDYDGERGRTNIHTIPQNVDTWKDGTDIIDDVYDYNDNNGAKKIRITFPDAATDINDNKHDVLVTIDNISFHDMSRVPNTTDLKYTNYSSKDTPEILDNPWGAGSSRTDKDKIPGNNDSTYDRFLLYATTGDLHFYNQITTGQGGPDSSKWLYSKGSGTYIDFTLSIADAQDNQSVLYWCDDLDLPENEYWKIDPSDPSKDELLGTNYDAGGEGIALGEGTDKDSIVFAKHTGLTLKNYGTDEDNYIISNGTDPTTSWSRFFVKGDATGSHYTWTTGTSCETAILKNTSFEFPDVLKVVLDINAEKTVNGKTPTGKYEKNIFKFTIEKATEFPTITIGDNTYPNLAENVLPTETEVTNAAKKVSFGELEFNTPGTELTHVYVYKISEKEVTEATIDVWDETEYFLKLIVESPKEDADMLKGTKATITIGKRKKGESSVTWGSDVIKYGKDTAKEAYSLNIGTFNNLTSSVTLAAGSIKVQKELKGRNWRDSDSFLVAMITEEADDPMPSNEVERSGLRHSDVVITNTDTVIDALTREDSVMDITFTLLDMIDDNGVICDNKTFTYHIREITPSESGDSPIAGITYSTERYEVEIKVSSKPQLDITSVKIYLIEEDDNNQDVRGDEVPAAKFTNTYDANKTVYKMSADKQFTSYDSEKILQNDDYEFVLKPIGTYAKIAPMPKKTTGSEENRSLTVANIGQGIHFEDTNDETDGLTFLYHDEGSVPGLTTLLLEYFKNDPVKVYEALHSDAGVDFEYEIYEIIPEGATNNNDGTWTYYDSEKHATIIFDGIHHTRKITVHVVPDEDDASQEVLVVEGHKDDHKQDFYIDDNGNEQPVSHLGTHYDAEAHHTAPDGAPLFHNQYIPDHGNLKVEKVWDDNNNVDRKRTVITFTLYKQSVNDDEPIKATHDIYGNHIEELTLDTLQDGSVIWSDLILYQHGDLVKYSVKESGVDDAYYTVISPSETTLEKDETSTITVTNVYSNFEPITKTINRTIHYRTNKGITVYEDIIDSVSFVATPVIRTDSSGIPILDDDGNFIVDWYDENETIIGTDSGDGSSIDWSKSTVEKKFKAVNSKEKDHYEYDVPVVEGIKVKPNDSDIEDLVIYTPDEYKIHFNPNGGKGSMSDQELTWDDPENLNPNLFTRDGYTFKGWNTKPDGSGRFFYDIEEVMNMLDELGNEITLYAQWQQDPVPPYVPPKTGI